ncbi:TnpV protein, partial [Agathobaculum butyriciproducens]|nr:TnpV protein [Agathobaculum butyriciproducens]
QTASPFGCLNNFYFKILSNFLGSLQREKLLYEVSPFGFYNPPEWIRRMNSIRSRAKEIEKSFQSLV